MKQVLTVLAFAGLVSACSVTVPLPYSPENNYEMTGGAAVSNFDYQPPKPLPSNQIRNTAVGEVFLPVPVGTHVANAVRKEFRYAGLSTKAESNCNVTGTVYDFAFDDLGYSVDFISDIEYVISDKRTNAEVFRNRYFVKYRGEKGGPNTFENINKMLSDNILKLMDDVRFQGLFGGPCRKP
jgi:hypothetical protein